MAIECVYRRLTRTFLRASNVAQIDAVYRDRDRLPDKIVEFQRAVDLGDVLLLWEALTKNSLRKLEELGIRRICL